MNYTESYLKLRDLFSLTDSVLELDNIKIHKFKFHSLHTNLLPGNNDYRCEKHALDFNINNIYYNDIGRIQENVHVKDDLVEENRDFQYHIITPANEKVIKKVTFLFHGFNEKNWDKYLVWAKAIAEQTKSSVILFPIAFHMQRSPQTWSDKRKMFLLSEKRRKKFPNIINSTLANVAISMRLHSMPQRFIWSGLQTYFDVIRFIEDCKAGKHPLIEKNFTFNIFAYSIGGLLAQILKLSNHKGYFSEAKVCLFCSGAVFNRLSPVSKFIIDSEANVALYSFLIEHFDSFLKKDPFLRHYIEGDHLEGKVFHSMLDYQKLREVREGLLKKVENHIYAISLKRDTVIPTFEIINTLQGAFRNINIKVDEFDFDFNYTHENPFPINDNDSQAIDSSFKDLFDKVGNFLIS